MKAYQQFLTDIAMNGKQSDDRTGTGTLRRTGGMFRHNMKHGFPAATTKKLAWQAVKAELIWFMRGCTNVEALRELTHGKGSKKWVIWDPNYEKQAVDLGYEDGYLGPVYGKQWRDWNGVDQLNTAINMIKENPNSRRIMVNSWNVYDLDAMALPPCHFAFQFLVNDGVVDLVWYQRSADAFLGVPFNIASYALLLEIVCRLTNTVAGELVGLFGDCHIYNDHKDQVSEILGRVPYDLPKLQINKQITDLSFIYDEDAVDCFELKDYKHHPVLKGKMSA